MGKHLLLVSSAVVTIAASLVYTPIALDALCVYTAVAVSL